MNETLSTSCLMCSTKIDMDTAQMWYTEIDSVPFTATWGVNKQADPIDYSIYGWMVVAIILIILIWRELRELL